MFAKHVSKYQILAETLRLSSESHSLCTIRYFLRFADLALKSDSNLVLSRIYSCNGWIISLHSSIESKFSISSEKTLRRLVL